MMRTLTILACVPLAMAAAPHYAMPPCNSDEVELQVNDYETNYTGQVCAPACGDNDSCPTDKPPSVATPKCILHDSGKKYCGLKCGFACGNSHMTCLRMDKLTRVCVYRNKPKPSPPKGKPSGLVASAAGQDLFGEFVKNHRREYSSASEKALRFEIFTENMKFIEETNSKNLSYTLGVTPFADLTFQEFRAQFVGGFVPMAVGNTTTSRPEGVAAISVDWVEKGAVTPVQNQGKCGSCWSFSTTGALEGAIFVARKKLVSLSEQELVSCDTGLLGGHGCRGGNPLQAMGWVKRNGICSETDVPYACMDMASSECSSATCAKKTCAPVLKGGGFLKAGDVTKVASVGTNEGDLEAAVSVQPVSVAIEADQPAFQHYTKGILTGDACGQNLDHAVLAVGYGTEGGQKYWKVKNSWSEKWGDAGYIRLARGVQDGYGECGIRHMASVPTVAAESESFVV